MDSTPYITVTHGITNPSMNILFIQAIIADDDLVKCRMLNAVVDNTSGVSDGGFANILANTLDIYRVDSRGLDNADHDRTDINRGFLYIFYKE